MKKIAGYLKKHLKQDFNVFVYLAVAILLSITIFYNYKVDFEDSFLDAQTGARKVFYFFLFYSFPFHGTLLLYAIVEKDFSNLRSRKFWGVSTIGFLILSFDSSALYVSEFTRLVFPNEHFYWSFKVSNNLLSLLTTILPLLILSFLIGRNQTANFGLNSRTFDAKPYFVMLLLMLPLLIFASFHASFLHQYPMYNAGGSMQNFPTPEYLYAGIYEFAYGLNFISVELFFRGFLVIGLMSMAGRKVVLAMAATYCFLHFGKPAGEAISSIFGGYILGVIAYETRSIWGGIIIHVGIAWAMEIIAHFHHAWR